MARWKKIAVWSLGTIVVLLAVAITATIGWRPFIGPKARPLTDRTFQSTPERLARGQYLVTAVDGCPMCHGEWDRSVDGHPFKQGELMAGRTWNDEGLPWLTAPNLTPDKETGAGTWTDDMLARAIREGIGHDGRTLFPVMPYQKFAKMADEDLASVIVYLRTLPAVARALPKTEIPFPPGPLINSVPQPVTEPVPMPDMNNQLARGEYMTRIAVCEDCHSPIDPQGTLIPGLSFAGGSPLQDRNTMVFSKNITQDPSGIPHYDEANFLQMMRTGKLIARDIDDMMPWAFYRNMSDDDLKAIYAFIKTVPPVKHTVDNALPPTPCPLCNYSHGGGDRNPAPSH
jgi:hypothetical protein